MTMSNMEAVTFALTPGSEKEGVFGINGTQWNKMGQPVRYARNALYCGVAIATITAIAAGLSDDKSKQYAYAILSAISAGLTGVAAKKLYEATAFVQKILNIDMSSEELFLYLCSKKYDPVPEGFVDRFNF